MTTIGDGHTRLPGMDGQLVKKTQRSKAKNGVEGAKSVPPKAPAKRSVSDLHDASNLREAVANLVDSGDLNTTSDGNVRQLRVEQARQNTQSGAYDDYGVLSDVVDRLLSQWNI